LLALRKESGLSSQEVADRLEWSQSMVSRIETGKRTVKPEEMSALLATYRVTGEERDRLMEMSRHGDRPNWLAESHGAAVPVQASLLAQYELEAASIVYVDLVVMPGIFQTRAYANAVMRASSVNASHIEPRVSLRLQRQKVLDRPRPPQILSFLDEAALRREIGGPSVMAEQITHLAMQAKRPNVTIRVVPFDRGGHAAGGAPYVLLEFDNGTPLVHIELRGAGLFLDDMDRISAYREATANLKAVALEPDESLRFMAEIASRYQRE
jgi:transcriptional regulator with XRE-family HTH domain